MESKKKKRGGERRVYRFSLNLHSGDILYLLVSLFAIQLRKKLPCFLASWSSLSAMRAMCSFHSFYIKIPAFQPSQLLSTSLLLYSTVSIRIFGPPQRQLLLCYVLFYTYTHIHTIISSIYIVIPCIYIYILLTNYASNHKDGTMWELPHSHFVLLYFAAANSNCCALHLI